MILIFRKSKCSKTVKCLSCGSILSLSGKFGTREKKIASHDCLNGERKCKICDGIHLEEIGCPLEIAKLSSDFTKICVMAMSVLETSTWKCMACDANNKCKMHGCNELQSSGKLCCNYIYCLR